MFAMQGAGVAVRRGFVQKAARSMPLRIPCDRDLQHLVPMTSMTCSLLLEVYGILTAQLALTAVGIDVLHPVRVLQTVDTCQGRKDRVLQVLIAAEIVLLAAASGALRMNGPVSSSIHVCCRSTSVTFL